MLWCVTKRLKPAVERTLVRRKHHAARIDHAEKERLQVIAGELGTLDGARLDAPAALDGADDGLFGRDVLTARRIVAAPLRAVRLPTDVGFIYLDDAAQQLAASASADRPR